jgi:hypothetical protein
VPRPHTPDNWQTSVYEHVANARLI